MTIKLAWRNIFRNKRRTFIAGTAIGIGLASLIFVDALIIGMKDIMVQSATASFLGEGQIHHQDYQRTGEVTLTINNPDQVVAGLKKEKVVEDFTLRTMSFGMITSPANVSSINLVGINPNTEKYLSQIDEALQKGSYFDGDNPRDIVIGNELAEILEVELGDRVVITVSEAETGDLSQEMFRISGIYHFNIQEMDKGMAFIRLHKAQEILAIGDNVHEIALTFTNTQLGRQSDHPFWHKYSQHGNKAQGWTELMPQLHAALELTDFSTLIIGIILFGVVALGIINTLFMAIHERIFEFGVLRAVGTRPYKVAQMILFEAGSLAIVSIILGNILGFIVTYITSQVGIDYTGIEFAGVTFRQLLYPQLKPVQFAWYPLWVFIITVLVGVYPAIYAAKITPVHALRKTL